MEYFSYTDELRDGWLGGDEADVPVAELLARVRDGLARRAAEWGNEAPHFGSFAGISPPDPTIPAQLAAIAAHLEQAASLMQQPDTMAVLAPSTATRLPVLGALWTLIRAQAHQLVLFYVNRQAVQTTKIQQHLLAAVDQLARIVSEQQNALQPPEEEQDGADTGSHQSGIRP